MSNIAKAFEHGKAFIPFITCGYPDLETTGYSGGKYPCVDRRG